VKADCFYCDGERKAVWPETAHEHASCEECREQRSERSFEAEQARFFGTDGPYNDAERRDVELWRR
jgi:hypothetical protein